MSYELDKAFLDARKVLSSSRKFNIFNIAVIQRLYRNACKASLCRFEISTNTLVSAFSILIRILIVTDCRLLLARIYLTLIQQLIAL